MSISSALLSSCLSDHVLYCGNKGLKKIPLLTRLAEHEPNISDIYLDHNHLISVPELLFQGLTNLLYINLENNQLSDVPEGLFQGLINLKEIWLYYNRLSSVPEGLFRGLKNLQRVLLDHNQLTSVPEGLFQGLTNLQRVSLDGNQLRSVPELFQGLKSLQNVSLERNQLSSVPEGLFHGLKNLQRVFLNRNQLNNVPERLFQGLTALHAVYLHNNLLSSVPEGLFNGLTNLENVCLDTNLLSTVPEGIFSGLSGGLKWSMKGNPVGELGREYLFFSEGDAVERLNQLVKSGDSKSVELALTQSHSKYLQLLLRGSEGLRLFSIASSRSDLIIKALIDHGFHQDLDLEHSGRNREALKMYQEQLSSLDESMEAVLADLVTKSDVFHPALAGMYRVKARLELESNDFESFFQTMDKAWLFHIRGHTQECEHLFWTKGIILQNLGDKEEASTVFESLVTKSSPLYVSFGLYELGLYEEAFCQLKNTIAMSREVLRLAQASRCLVRLGRVDDEARTVYHRLQVFAKDSNFREQKLYFSEVKFVTQVKDRMKTFLENHPKYMGFYQ